MPRELTPDITPITLTDLWDGLLLMWETLGVPVKRHAVELKLAHIMSEVGAKLNACHRYNLGNRKSANGDGFDYQYFACGEEIRESKLAAVSGMRPGLVTVKGRYMKGGVPWCSIWIALPADGGPRHPWTKFAAFEDLVKGIETQLAYLRRHPDVLEALETGIPETYNAALEKADYYTADAGAYLRLLKGSLAHVLAATKDFNWGDVS